MSLWEIIVPSGSDYINLVTNPSIEPIGSIANTTGWNAYGAATVDDVSTYARRGSYSLEVGPSASADSGAHYDAVALTSGVTYQGSIDVLGVAGVPYQSTFCTTAGAAVGTATTFTGNGEWQRINVEYSATATTNFQYRVQKNNSASTAAFYLDGLSIVAATAEVRYFDGDSPGCHWNGGEQASTSTASGQDRRYGSYVDPDDYGFYIQEIGSVGMPLVDNRVDIYATKPGAEFTGQKVLPRVFLIQGETVGTSRSDYHSKRQSLLDVIKPDYLKGNQEITLAYTGSNTNKRALISARYDDGFGMGAMNGYSEKIAIRLLATDPFWYEDGGNSVTAANGYQTESSANRIIWYRNNAWAQFGTGANSGVYGYEIKDQSNIFIYGNFNTINSVTASYIAKHNAYTNTTSVLGTNPLLAAVNDAKFAPNGDTMYLAGAFTHASSDNYLQIYTLSTDSFDGWANANTTAWSVDIAPDGYVYVGGAFVTLDGASFDRIAQYDPVAGTFANLGSGISDGVVYAVKCARDGMIYAGGSFTTGGSSPSNYVARWNGSTWSTMGGTSCNGNVRAIIEDARGNIYIGGAFTTAPDGTSAIGVAKWNGRAWSALGGGIVSGTVYELVIHDNLLYALGDFDGNSTTPMENIGVWNGSEWLYYDVYSGDYFWTMAFDDQDNIYLGMNADADIRHPVTATVTNAGTTAVNPLIECYVSAGSTQVTAALIRNKTSGASIQLDYDMVNGEKLYIDTENARVISSHFGDVTGRSLVRGTSLNDFTLLPGSNLIHIYYYVVGSPSISTYIRHPVKHWSLDGVA